MSNKSLMFIKVDWALISTEQYLKNKAKKQKSTVVVEKNPTTKEVTPVEAKPNTANTIEKTELDIAIEKYVEKFWKKPNHNAKLETILAKLT